MPYKDELKIKEYNIFKSYYCGLCKTIKREYGYVARMGLNYDLTFLALLLSSIDEQQNEVVSEVCIANPIKKKPVAGSNKYLSYSASINVMLVYFKLVDDWVDEHKLGALAGLTLYYFSHKKAARTYPRQHDLIKKRLGDLAMLEKRQCGVIDEAADTFANLMGDIFECGDIILSPKTTRILRWIGYNIGRWIYILDAFDDIEKDIRQKSYNPVLLQYKYDKKDDPKDFKLGIQPQIEETLTFTLDNVARSFELLDILHNRSILENIIYMGTRDKMQKIFYKGAANNEKSL